MRRLPGWQSPGFDGWMRRGTFALVNLQLGEFIYFSCYVAVGLVPPASSFLFMLLEFYGLQLRHLSPHSLVLVVIFVQFCEIFVCVRPSVTLFQMFHMLRWSRNGSGLIGAYYFQLQAKGPIVYITPISPRKWDHWREDWVVVWADIHDRLVLPTESQMAKKTTWEETPKLHVAYRTVIKRIKHLTSHGLSTMMVLHDFLSRRIAPLQDRARSAWMYTREGDTTRLECGRDSGLDPDVLGALLVRLSPNPSSVDFVTPLVTYTPMCLDQAVRTRLLRELPTLDDIDITTQQRGDESWGIQIPWADVVDGQGGASTGPSSSKEKGKVVPHIVLSNTKVSSEEDDVPLQRRMRQFHSVKSTISEPPLSGLQAPERPPLHSLTQGWRHR
jgi:hypothetical protein